MKVGIASFLGLNRNVLKRQYLLLDNLYLDGLQEIRNAISGAMLSGATGLGIGLSIAYQRASRNKDLKEYFRSITPDIEFLADDGFLINIPENNIGQGIGLEKLKNELGINPYALKEGFNTNTLVKIQHFSTRLKCHMLRRQSQYDFIPLLGEPLSGNSDQNKSVVVSIVLDKFPIIHPNLTWRELNQFKQEFKLDHLRLKNYINELSGSDFKISEVEEKIEYDLEVLKDRYEYYDQDYDLGRLEMFLVFGNRLLKDVAERKYLRATKKLLKFRVTDIQLMDEELDIPNKDLSYILEAQKRLI